MEFSFPKYITVLIGSAVFQMYINTQYVAVSNSAGKLWVYKCKSFHLAIRNQRDELGQTEPVSVHTPVQRLFSVHEPNEVLALGCGCSVT